MSSVRVLEFEGIGPGPLGACMLADFGADVVTLSRSDAKGRVRSKNDPVSRGKRSITMNLKDGRAVELVKRIIKNVDVLIEPFRPGVMERLGLGPDVLLKINPRLIYTRMTGWGQSGDPAYVNAAGHDANYLALSGTLSLFRRANDVAPSPPANFAGDYAGGATMLAMGVLLAHIERQKSGKGQVIDVAMVDGANYISLPLFKWLQMGTILREKDERGHVDSEMSALHQAPHWCGVYVVESFFRNISSSSSFSHTSIKSKIKTTLTADTSAKTGSGSAFKQSNPLSTENFSRDWNSRSRRCRIKVMWSRGLGCANDLNACFEPRRETSGRACFGVQTRV